MKIYIASLRYGMELLLEAHDEENEEDLKKKAAEIFNHKPIERPYISPCMINLRKLPDEDEYTHLVINEEGLLQCSNCGKVDEGAMIHEYCPFCGKRYYGVKGSDK